MCRYDQNHQGNPQIVSHSFRYLKIRGGKNAVTQFPEKKICRHWCLSEDDWMVTKWLNLYIRLFSDQGDPLKRHLCFNPPPPTCLPLSHSSSFSSRFVLALSSVFFPVSLLNPLTPLLFIYPVPSSLSPPHPRPSTLWPHHHSLWVFHFPMTEPVMDIRWLTSLLSPALRNLRCERDLCTSGPFIASGGMHCVVHTEKDLVWLEFLGANGKIWASLF